MKKGTVMAISRWHTTVFTDDCQLVKVRTRPDLSLGQEIQLDEGLVKDRGMTPVRSTTTRRRLMPAMVAISLFLVVAVSILFSQGLIFNPVYAQISVDVNPSVEFSLNRDLDVIAVRAMNPDAASFLDAERYQGIPWQEAIEQWVDELHQTQQIQVQNMLISAVMPDSAELLRTHLMSLEGTENPGAMYGINVRVIFSHDQMVARQALRNNLSIGRQMLLNQARLQNRDLSETSIEEAPLGELIRSLLQKGQPDQTRLTERSTQSLSDPTDQTSGSESQKTSTDTQRETNRETSGSTQGSSDGSQQTSQSTRRETSRETNGGSQGSSDSSSQTNGSQGTSGSTQESQQTNGSQQTSGSSQGSSGGSQESTGSSEENQQTSGSQESMGSSQENQQTSGSSQDSSGGTQEATGSTLESQQTSSGTHDSSDSPQTSGTTQGSQQTSSSSQGGGNGGH